MFSPDRLNIGNNLTVNSCARSQNFWYGMQGVQHGSEILRAELVCFGSLARIQHCRNVVWCAVDKADAGVQGRLGSRQ